MSLELFTLVHEPTGFSLVLKALIMKGVQNELGFEFSG
jgi:hypothetical protein